MIATFHPSSIDPVTIEPATIDPTAIEPMANSVIHGDCVDVMRTMRSASLDFILTDPPYLVRYRDRSGRTVLNDDTDAWLAPAFAEMYRVLRSGTFCVSFYGYQAADQFIAAWRRAGFRIAGHFVFPKSYASSTYHTQRCHEQAYLLVKGNPQKPVRPIPDVLAWKYAGNRLHPTQKPVSVLKPLIRTFTEPGQKVLDPFAGSGSTLVAAQRLGRKFIGIELDAGHCRTATSRIASSPAQCGSER